MTDWNTRRSTLEPSLTMVALQARRDPGGHFVQVRQWEARRRRAGLLADAVFGAALLVVGLGLWYLALAVLAWR